MKEKIELLIQKAVEQIKDTNDLEALEICRVNILVKRVS